MKNVTHETFRPGGICASFNKRFRVAVRLTHEPTGITVQGQTNGSERKLTEQLKTKLEEKVKGVSNG